MTHPVGQIIDAVADGLRAIVESKGEKVFLHRRLSLSAEQGQFPARSLNLGEDHRSDKVLLNRIDSAIAIEAEAYALGETEGEVIERLLEMRADLDALMVDVINTPAGRKLGLNFVQSAMYGGAEKPDINTDGDQPCGALKCTWFIGYRLA